MLMFLGSNPAADPFIVCSKIFTILYFLYFIIILPFISFLDDSIVESNKKSE